MTPKRCPRREAGRSVAVALAVLVLSLLISVPASLAATTNLAYDPNGNLASDGERTYEYDGFNQLVKVRNASNSSQIIEEYAYDAQGRRVIKVEPQLNQTTHYVSKIFIRIFNSSGTFDQLYIYDGDTLLARRNNPGNKTVFYHPDHLGSTTLVTDSAGQLVEETTYEPFGLVVNGGNDRFLYTGKELDKGTGLEYYGARYYCPECHFFTQPDSIIPDPYSPQALNRYAYTLNNPYKYTDPSGNIYQLIGTFALGFLLSSGVDVSFNNGWIDVSKATVSGFSSIAGNKIGGAAPVKTLLNKAPYLWVLNSRPEITIGGLSLPTPTLLQWLTSRSINPTSSLSVGNLITDSAIQDYLADVLDDGSIDFNVYSGEVTNIPGLDPNAVYRYVPPPRPPPGVNTMERGHFERVYYPEGEIDYKEYKEKSEECQCSFDV